MTEAEKILNQIDPTQTKTLTKVGKSKKLALKRGPKPKPAELHRVTKIFRLAPDVADLINTVPKGKRAQTVDEAIRLLFKSRNRKKAKSQVDYTKVKS